MEAGMKSKLLETFWLFWTFVLIGFDNGILGPCLPDLQALVEASLGQMSYVFFAQGTGGLLGFASGLLLERHFDCRLLLALYAIAGSAVNIAIPQVASYVYVVIMFFLQGLTKGLADFEAMSVCNMLWKENKALAFQFIVSGAGIATFISPFIAQPFISDRSSPHRTAHNPATVTDTCTHAPQTDNSLNGSALSGIGSAWNRSISVSADTLSSSDVSIPFMIVGAVTLPAGIAFLYYYFYPQNADLQAVSVLEEHDVDDLNTGADQSTGLISDKRKSQRALMAFKSIVVLLHFPVFGLLLTFADLLTSVAMTSPMCMTPLEASYLVIVLWGSAALGRAMNGIMVVCVPMFHLLLFCSLALIGCGVALVVQSTDMVGLWFGTAGVGIFLTPSMPGYLAWSAEFTPVTSTFLSICLSVSGVGEMLFPFLGGQLMAVYGKVALMWFCLAVMIVMPLLFLLAYAFGKSIKKINA